MNSKLKYNLYFVFGAILIIGTIVTLLVSNGKGTYSLNNTPTLRLECPATVGATEEVTCDIYLDITNANILSVNANYALPTGAISGDVTFSALTTCNSNNCFEKFVSNANGFAVINQNGTTTNAKVGSITFTMNGESNAEYTIGLKNIELCNNTYDMISLSNVSTTIRVKNNVATLSNIALDKQVISSNFDAVNRKYTATIADNNEATDMVNLVLTKVDTNATVSGVTNNLSLHYGTNTYNILVTAENGTTTNNYTIEIKREYDFDPGNNGYIYNKTSNYLYIKNDNINNFQSNLKELPTNLSYSVNSNKLEVLYDNDEVLNSINIINFSSDYQVSNGTIYVDSELTLQQIKNKITSQNVNIKYYNGNTEITSNSTTIKNGYTMKVYYNNSLLDTYTIQIAYLTFDNSLVVDDNKKIIKRIQINETFGSLKTKISTNGTIILETNGAVTDNYKLRTGDVIKIALTNQTLTYTISVVGCLDETAEISTGDVIKVYRYFKQRMELTDAEIAAADIRNDGSVGFDDVILIYRYLKGRINSLEEQ